jgi:PBP1b-binding outer membrane lipoprotein LpoB
MITKCRNVITICSILLIINSCRGIPPSSSDSSTSGEGQAIPVDSASPASTTPAPVNASSLAEALGESSRVISEELYSGASVAVISINAPDFYEGEYALEELTLLLVRTQKFRIVDRQNLDVIRTEQQFQLSGEVDDETAISIGHLIGAAFVITGSITPWESAKHLRLRVLDVQTGQIRAMTSVSYGGDL